MLLKSVLDWFEAELAVSYIILQIDHQNSTFTLLQICIPQIISQWRECGPKIMTSNIFKCFASKVHHLQSETTSCYKQNYCAR